MLHILGMQGLGDNIYQLAFIRQLVRSHSDIYLETAWPQLYAGLPIKIVNPDTRLRTQAKNVARSKVAWAKRPGHRGRRVSYVNAFRQGRSIVQGMEESFGISLDPADFGLPPLPPSPLLTERPIAFVRPVTVRREWYNSARNPDPQYIADIVELLRPTHHIVTVADVDRHDENLVGPPLRADSEFIRGELQVMDMLALLGAADIVIGGVGFIVPASIALKRRCFVILGGQGGHNAPRMILDRRLDCSRIGFAMPKDFCQCTNMRHECSKTISNLPEQWKKYCDSVAMPPPSVASPGIQLASAVIQ